MKAAVVRAFGWRLRVGFDLLAVVGAAVVLSIAEVL